MQPDGILETVIYANDLAKIRPFYTQVLGLEILDDSSPHHIFFRCHNNLFLVFNPKESCQQNMTVAGTEIPRHGARGPSHMAFRVQESEMDVWKQKLAAHHVEVEADILWPQGGRSLYFRDPAKNSIELATARLWELKD